MTFLFKSFQIATGTDQNPERSESTGVSSFIFLGVLIKIQFSLNNCFFDKKNFFSHIIETYVFIFLEKSFAIRARLPDAPRYHEFFKGA